MTETLALIAPFMIGILILFGTVLYFAWRVRQANRHLYLQDHHLARLINQATDVAAAHHQVRHGSGAFADRLALDRAVGELTTAAEAARKREPVP